MTYDALVLAGGTARRLGGIDKPGLLVDGVSLLDRVLLACCSAASRVVVGPARSTVVPVHWVAEAVPFGGPTAALAAGLPVVTADVVVLLAADLPSLDVATVERLAASQGLLVADGREQWLCSAWRTADLRAALDGVPVVGASLRQVLEPLASVRLEVSGPGAWMDVDTPADLALARQQARSSAA